MRKQLRELVWSRADDICEYCRVPQTHDPLPFGIDHIRAEYHNGPTVEENLALACFNDNTFKGTNLAGHDPATDELTQLFNPRTDDWLEHFRFDGPIVTGKTPIGRTTVDVLRMNLPDRIEHRRLLQTLGVSL